jgi:hypothetical protein
MNRTLMDKARNMPNGVGLAQEFWAKATEMNPHEVWSS